MKKLLLFILSVPLFLHAQDKSLLAEGVSPGLFITHKVAPKENFYSIGRIYNISPREIAPFNNLQLEAGLSLGQVLRIPLSSSNFFQAGSADADETFVPVYHIVSTKEGLYRIAVNYNNLPLETLKQWNNIKGNAVKNGTKLIVGYLKVKTELSPLAKKGIGTSITSNATASVIPEDKKSAEPDKKTVTARAGNTDIEKKEADKAKQVEPADTKQVKEDEVKAAKPEKKGVVNPVKETVIAEPKKTTNTGKNIIGGLFKNTYELQTNNTELIETAGTSGIFKSTSGWADKKYYCLYNSASQGTIIKITNPANGKFVFAKVLDLMPDIKQNESLLICISNAAAEELGATDGNFNCQINYAK